jgi:carbamoyl-phosphate synthase small subunit
VKAFLVLEDGMVFEGTSFGACGERIGTVVFTTGMVGYEGLITDPATKGQIIVMTYPLIGNYGISPEDLESDICHCEALVIREKSRIRSNFRSKEGINEFAQRHSLLGVTHVDTRALAIHIRENGEMKGLITTRPSGTLTSAEIEDLAFKARSYIPKRESPVTGESIVNRDSHNLRVVTIDMGIRRSLLVQFERLGIEVLTLPGGAKASDILELKPHGIFISSGPEDLELIEEVALQVKELLGKKPIFGVGTGNLVLGRALGASIIKMKCGHRGANHSVRRLDSGKLEITLQHHVHVLDPESVLACGGTITHENIVDGTVEGISSREHKAFALQYIPTNQEAESVSSGFMEFKGML